MSGGSGKVKETSSEKESASIALDQWTDFKTRWKPAQDAYIRRVRADYKPLTQVAQGTASNDVDGQFGKVNTLQTLQSRGVGMNGGKARFAVNGTDTAQAASRGLATVSAKQASEDRHQQQLEGLTAVGRGQQAGGVAGLQTLAGLSAATARNDAQIEQNNADALGETVGTVIGASASLYAAGRKPAQTSSTALKTWGTDTSRDYRSGDTW